MKCPVPPRVPDLEVTLMAQALCDADASLEGMKRGRRCVERGCPARKTCIAFHQARALVRLFGKVWERRQAREGAAASDPAERRFSV